MRKAAAAVTAALLPAILLGEALPVIIEPRTQVTILPFTIIMTYHHHGTITIDLAQLLAIYLIYEAKTLHKTKTTRTPNP